VTYGTVPDGMYGDETNILREDPDHTKARRELLESHYPPWPAGLPRFSLAEPYVNGHHSVHHRRAQQLNC
jgi:hypothetical protein